MEQVYLFQNWEFGSNSLDEFNKWDKEGKVIGKLKQQDVYIHTDSQWGFLIISLNKEKLLAIAEERRQKQIEEYESKIKWLKRINF
ncbi:hypothetical protein SDC9_114786 [bioreactor metagenome]|uniref:Uncharacterized protein n=1 Tax=bioreactor metagenome TaxID=1076179 RepID=A0A645BTC1_9ZZZZ